MLGFSPISSTPISSLPIVTGGGATGSLSVVNANDSVVASGSVSGAVTGSLSVINANDTSASSGVTTVKGSLASTNLNDLSAASGSVGGGSVSGSVNVLNANDTLAATGYTVINGIINIINNNDTLVAEGIVLTGIIGVVNYINADDSVVASGNSNDSAVESGTVGGGGYGIGNNDYLYNPDYLSEKLKQKLESKKQHKKEIEHLDVRSQLQKAMSHEQPVIAQLPMQLQGLDTGIDLEAIPRKNFIKEFNRRVAVIMLIEVSNG